MTEQLAFLSLARRLGNPLADSAEAAAAIDDFDVLRAFRALPPAPRRMVRVTLGCLAKLLADDQPPAVSRS